MPSRRTLLRAGACGVTATLAGCHSRLGLARTGELQLKAVSVAWTHRGRRYRDEVLFVALDESGIIDGRVDEPLTELVADPANVTVPDAVHESLARRFEAVAYVLGFCGTDFGSGPDRGCRNTRARRQGFNRVQFGDRADVRLVDRDGGDAFRIGHVSEGSRTDWRSDVTTFDFDGVHADHGR